MATLKDPEVVEAFNARDADGVRVPVRIDNSGGMPKVFNAGGFELRVEDKITKMVADKRVVYTIKNMDDLLTGKQHPYSQYIIVEDSEGKQSKFDISYFNS